jgi:hypothetical protein
MKKIIQRSFSDIKILAYETGSRLMETTSSVAEIHVENLKGQLDNLWQMAEDMLPRTRPSDIMENVERRLAEIRAWKQLGLPGEFAT